MWTEMLVRLDEEGLGWKGRRGGGGKAPESVLQSASWVEPASEVEPVGQAKTSEVPGGQKLFAGHVGVTPSLSCAERKRGGEGG